MYVQVSTIRNNLAHYALKENLVVDDQKLQTDFQHIEDLVRCLGPGELQHFSEQERDDTLAKLNEVTCLIFVVI